jgi:hypothetical protein
MKRRPQKTRRICESCNQLRSMVDGASICGGCWHARRIPQETLEQYPIVFVSHPNRVGKNDT